MPAALLNKATEFPCPICLAMIPTWVSDVRAGTMTGHNVVHLNPADVTDVEFFLRVDVDPRPIRVHMEQTHGVLLLRARGVKELGVPEDYEVEGAG